MPCASCQDMWLIACVVDILVDILVDIFQEWLRRDIPAGKFEKIDKTLIDIDDFCVHELGIWEH